MNSPTSSGPEKMQRRALPTIIPGVLAIALTNALLLTSAFADPNIVFIMADDLGWSDTSNGLTNLGNPSDFYETPMLERLAAEGMAFTNAYTSGPNCAPTRSALLTGQYAQRPTNNVYLVNSLNRGGSNTLLVGPSQGLPNGVDAIPNNAFTYAEMLQADGYATAHFGKFHVTNTGSSGAADIINHHGFDQNFGGTTSGTPGSYHASGGQFGSNIGPELDVYAADYTRKPMSTRTSNRTPTAPVMQRSTHSWGPINMFPTRWPTPRLITWSRKNLAPSCCSSIPMPCTDRSTMPRHATICSPNIRANRRAYRMTTLRSAR